ncbi:single-stranded DNA-binding protein [Listeria goaensis]|uniref:single-stranded DNA-binding protein n=1 Tax=Listeria goaensis TaxID=1649188 RepID=UPI000B59484F|nr:single-stranded DNA-binding protein [Listeria goaensis]
MINRVVLVGRLTKDPNLRYTPNGIAVASFTIAVNRLFTNQQGEREADFIQCIVWRKAAENVANFLQKGNLAGIDGRLQTRQYKNKNGHRIFVTEVHSETVHFLERRGNKANKYLTTPYEQGGGLQDTQIPADLSNQVSDSYLSDDDLPF